MEGEIAVDEPFKLHNMFDKEEEEEPRRAVILITVSVVGLK